MPIEDFQEPERNIILNVAKIMLTVHYPQKKSSGWVVETEDKHYNISVFYPADTIFDLDQLSLVQQVNPTLVSRVWIQPEKERVVLCASILKPSESIINTVHDIYIIQKKQKMNKSGKRIKISVDEKEN